MNRRERETATTKAAVDVSRNDTVAVLQSNRNPKNILDVAMIGEFEAKLAKRWDPIWAKS